MIPPYKLSYPGEINTQIEGNQILNPMAQMTTWEILSTQVT
jgi:hypothetical protein